MNLYCVLQNIQLDWHEHLNYLLEKLQRFLEQIFLSKTCGGAC